jgi:hypothetical protein
MKRVNLGCGNCFHREWVNLDATPLSPEVMSCDIRQRLPFDDEAVDVIYHSHVLEHLTTHEGEALLRECARVLRRGGMMRVVVPDLERIARAYLGALELAANGGDATLHTWTRLELIDQAARSVSGGEMLPWLRQLTPEQVAQVRTRAGHEVAAMLTPRARGPWWTRLQPGRVAAKLRATTLRTVVRLAGGRKTLAALEEGQFRQSGEVHRVMYDRVALTTLLHACGFVDSAVVAATQSGIPEFARFGLDAVDGTVRKPDSLFMEAVKP